MRRIRTVVAVGATALVVGAGLLVSPASAAGSNSGSGSHVKRVRILDDCDPVSFNQALGPGACVGDGDTTLDEVIAELQATGTAKEWAFKPAKVRIKSTDRIRAVNLGGEAHTFTEVRRFGGGCVPEINQLLGLSAVPECGNPANFPGGIVGPGGVVHVHRLNPGTHRFECLIHPWMRSTVTVRAKHHHG